MPKSPIQAEIPTDLHYEQIDKFVTAIIRDDSTVGWVAVNFHQHTQPEYIVSLVRRLCPGIGTEQHRFASMPDAKKHVEDHFACALTQKKPAANGGQNFPSRNFAT